MAQEAAMLVIMCSCGQRMKVPAEAMGKTATCVKCGERLRITAETTDPSDTVVTGPARSGKREEPSPEADPIRLLRQNQLITERSIEEVLLLQKDFSRSMWDLLIDLGHVTSEDFHALMSRQKGIASIDLPNYHIPREVLDTVPAELAYRGLFIPVDRLGKLLTLAMACPLDTAIIREVEEQTGLRVKRMLAPVHDIKVMLQKCHPQFSKAVYFDDTESQDVYAEFETVLNVNESARRIITIESLSPSQQTADNIDAILDAGGNGTALPMITDLVAMDPIATAMLLRVSNSDAYGFSQRVDGLGLACALLGSRGIAAVVRSANPMSHRTNDGYDYEGFWARAQFCAEAAQMLATRTEGQNAITAYTAGLLHDIGKLALNQAAPKSYPEIAGSVYGADRIATEERVYHIASPEAGYMLARKWGFPRTLAEAIRHHRKPQEARYARDLTNIVALAALMADAHERAVSVDLDAAEAIFGRLELTRAEVVAVFQEAQASSQQAAATRS